ncbi:MAG: phenylalanine--tRNA ligase subunit beta, partial [Acidobacteria bacterium]|nr:phenylalanine--tRNA ligase subunit beta [Acidobacteriota bacterium]
MNISYNWLKDLIDLDMSADELAEKLTRVGLAVEGVHRHGDDQILDIDLTSNRPDCLCHLGVVREVVAVTQAAALALRTALPGEKTRAVASAPLMHENRADLVTIDDPDLCSRFTARIIRNVKVGPSPKWLVERLEAVGERSINNVADITNYVMLDLGQPMHAFDLDKLVEGRIVVRRARPGEKIVTLKEEEKELDSSILAICDAEKPVAVGGIIGGLKSSITDTTVNVLLEVAYFNRSNIRASSRKLSISTEASYRFERGVDIDALIRASDRATALICELADGEAADFADIYPVQAETLTIQSPDISGATKRLTGLNVDKSD